MEEFDRTEEPEGPPKPDTEPVREVSDSELDHLEEAGAKDVAFLPDDQADADDTVDNQENDTPPDSPPIPGPDTTPPGEEISDEEGRARIERTEEQAAANREAGGEIAVDPNQPEDDVVVEGDEPEPDIPINPVRSESDTPEDSEMSDPVGLPPESFEADPNDDGIDAE